MNIALNLLEQSDIRDIEDLKKQYPDLPIDDVYKAIKWGESYIKSILKEEELNRVITI